MSIALKDAVWFIVYIVSVVSIFLAFRNEVKNLKKEVQRERGIIWQNGGRLNLVDHKTCRDFRDILHEAIRQRDMTIEEFRGQLKILNENVLEVKIYLEQLLKKNKDNV